MKHTKTTAIKQLVTKLNADVLGIYSEDADEVIPLEDSEEDLVAQALLKTLGMVSFLYQFTASDYILFSDINDLPTGPAEAVRPDINDLPAGSAEAAQLNTDPLVPMAPTTPDSPHTGSSQISACSEDPEAPNLQDANPLQNSKSKRGRGRGRGRAAKG